MALATADDVAKAMGLGTESDIPESQLLRLPGELARVENAFTRAAGRKFLAGAVTVQAVVLGGWITLPDVPTAEPTVTDRDGDPVDVDVDGSRVKVSRDGVTLPSGSIVNVEYTAPDVPAAITASVAAIVARRLSVTPGSAETKYTELSTLDYRAKGAAWVSATSVLTADETAEAATYRPVHGAVIIARWQ